MDKQIEDILNNINVPAHCMGVKCMVEGCTNMSSHKIGEENVWSKDYQPEQHEAANMSHNLTSYVCDKHFDLVMNRDTKYQTTDARFQIDSKFIRYELDIRKWSSNCIKGIYIHIDDKGKPHEKSELILGPFLNKDRGDKYAELLVKYLNSLLLTPEI